MCAPFYKPEPAALAGSFSVFAFRDPLLIDKVRDIEANLPPELDVPLVRDNYATHKTPATQRWLVRHPRYHVHFTPPRPVGSTR